LPIQSIVNSQKQLIMATVTATKKQAGTNDAANVRKTAQREYVGKLQADLLKKNKDAGIGVFVLPVFDDKGKQSNAVVRETVSPTLSMVMVMSVGEMAYHPEQRMWRQDIRSTLIFAPTSFLSTKYQAGTNIGGKIITKYTFGKGNDRDIMLGFGTDIPAVNEDGEVIYRTQFWTPEVNAQDDPAPVIANLEEIKQARATAIAANNGKLPARK
jgi:hypothetical protein